MNIPMIPGDSTLANAYLQERGEAHIGAQEFGLTISKKIESLTKPVIGNPIYSIVSLACLGIAVRSFLSPEVNVEDMVINTVRDARIADGGNKFFNAEVWKSLTNMGLIFSMFSITTALPVLSDYEKRINE